MNKLTYIDNCQLDHFILRKILSRFGSAYDVKCTDTGKGILNLLSRHTIDVDRLPDIILLDIYIPGFDSWEFLDKMQALYPYLPKKIEIYILSASNYPADIERAQMYSCVKAFILKPITKEVMLKLISYKESSINKFTALEYQN